MDNDSIYTQCAAEARRMAEQDEPFTEMDVVRQAAARRDWIEDDFAKADGHAPQILATLYRNSKVVRFGVVAEDAPLTGEPDYVRRDGCILYANRKTWKAKGKLKTPNGEFQPIFYGDDPLLKVGRRKASERNDFIPWDKQVPTADEPEPDKATLQRELLKLRTALNAATRKIERLETENSRLRSRRAASVRA